MSLLKITFFQEIKNQVEDWLMKHHRARDRCRQMIHAFQLLAGVSGVQGEIRFRLIRVKKCLNLNEVLLPKGSVVEQLA